MVYHFWSPTESRIDYLKSIGMKELECNVIDREVLRVDTEKKTFKIVNKHSVESYNLITEFTTVLFEE